MKPGESMKRVLLHAVLAGGAALPILLFGTATAASAEESCLLVVCSSPQPAEPEPQPEQQPQPSHRSSAEITADLLALINRDRAAHDLPTFTRRDDVDAVAAGWSDHLADANELSHNDAYFTNESRQRLGARALGENVAMDYEAAPAHKNLMDSPRHRDNILDARFTVIGLGATYRDGKWWITENFLQPASPASREREVVRSAGTPARTSPPSSGTVAPPAAAAPAPTTTAVEAEVATPSESNVLTIVPDRARSEINKAAPVTSSGKVPASAAGVAVAGMCGVSGLFVRRWRVLAELATTS